MLRAWVKTYPQVMQNLFSTLSERFKVVAGAASRKLPSPRLGIVVTSPRGYVLAGRLAARLLVAGERLRVWACQPSRLKSAGSWPDDLPVQNSRQTILRCCSHPRPRLIGKSSSGRPALTTGSGQFKQLLGCDEVLWLLEPRDATNVSQDLLSLVLAAGRTGAEKCASCGCSMPTLRWRRCRGWKFKKADVKVAVESTGGTLTRQERQGLDRLVRALRGISVGIALAGGGAKGMAHFGVLQALEQAGLSFDAMSGTGAGQWREFSTPRACRRNRRSRTSSTT